MDKESDKVELNIKFPIKIEWVIDKDGISDEDMHPISTKYYRIPGFPFLDYNMRFRTDSEQQQFYLDLAFSQTDNFKAEADLILTINDKEPKTKFPKYDNEYGFFGLWEGSIEELLDPEKNYFIKNKITLQLNGTITVFEYSNRVFSSIRCCYYFKQSLREEPKDFVIEAEKKEIKVHKKLLQKLSPVFSAMLKDNLNKDGWKEAVEGRVIIPEFPFETIEKVIKLCYGEHLYQDMDKRKVLLLFQFANKYIMEELKKTIKKVLFLTPNNICEYANFYYEENCVELVNYCIDRLIVYFQYSYPVKNLDSLNMDIKVQFFNRASESDAMKKEFPVDYHKSKNDEIFTFAKPF